MGDAVPMQQLSGDEQRKARRRWFDLLSFSSVVVPAIRRRTTYSRRISFGDDTPARTHSSKR